jgi:ABC-type glutathione transport system ATPase component
MRSRRLLDIKDLRVSRASTIELDGVSLTLDAGEALVILGDGSSGKDALLRIIGNFSDRGQEATGTIQFGDGEARPAHKRGRSNLRTTYLASARVAPLNPHVSVVSQLTRVVANGLGVPGSSASEDLRLALERLAPALPFAALSKKSGEMRDDELAWAMLAAAVAQTPDLLIADHAFSGLTPTAVAALAGALADAQKRQGFGLAYFAEALQTAAHLRCRTIVLRQGKVIEEGDFEKLAGGQSHAYTKTLFKALPRLSEVTALRGNSRGEPLLQVQGLDLSPRGKKPSSASDAISFELRRGAALALVGEEGSGRRALVRALLGLQRFARGRVVLDQVDMGILSAAMTSRLRRRIAFVTGSDAALDPRMTLWDTVDEPLRAHLHLPRDMIAGYRETALKRVGLASHAAGSVVATLSGFDKRRLQVARAIVSAPFLCVIDEPLRGLDAFAQSIMIELLTELRKQEGPAFLLITADMRVAQALADDAIIFKQGKLVERGPLAEIMRAPKDDETKKLLAAAAPSRGPEPPAAPATIAAKPASQQAPVSPDELDPPILLDEPIADESAVTESPG